METGPLYQSVRKVSVRAVCLLKSPMQSSLIRDTRRCLLQVHKYHCEDGYIKIGQNTIICEAGLWTEGPTCIQFVYEIHATGISSSRETTGHHGGSAATSGSNDRDSRPVRTNIQLCGNHPVIQNAEVVLKSSRYLTYRCNRFYRRVGPRTVNCYSNGSWSQLPTCEEAFCVMDPAKYARYDVKPGQPEYIEEEETCYFNCNSRNYYIKVQCTNRRITLARCCPSADVDLLKWCNQFREPN